MDENGNILDEWFGKSIIESKASLTYDQAQQRIEEKEESKDPITISVKQLNVLAKVLRRKRMEAGALTLASPEVRFQLEHSTQDPIDVEMKELKDANALVEEFMLLANIRVATQIYKHFSDISLLRRHPIPPPSNFQELNSMLQTKNMEIDPANSKTVGASLDNCVDDKDSYFNKLIRIMATRCMMQAVYFCSGTVSFNEFVHYGLATPIYTHFTSPIRRYAGIFCSLF